MDSSTPGDAETIRKLGETLKAHRGDIRAWTRLGGQFRERRELAGYWNRREFWRKRGAPNGLDYKFIYDLEPGPAWGRKGVPASRMPAIAASYGVTLASIGSALDGGDLMPAPESAPGLPPPGPPPAVRLSGVLSDAAIVAAAPYATAIMTRLRAFPENAKPSGSKVFLENGTRVPGLDADRAALLWDDHDYMPEEERVWLIAALQADRDAAARPDSSVG